MAKVYSTLAQICIEDNGPGIDESIRDQIFFPMVSSKDSGSGLGLSISQDIIRVHGGSIEVFLGKMHLQSSQF